MFEEFYTDTGKVFVDVTDIVMWRPTMDEAGTTIMLRCGKEIKVNDRYSAFTAKMKECVRAFHDAKSS